MSSVLISQLEGEFPTFADALERARWYSARHLVEHCLLYPWAPDKTWRLQISYHDFSVASRLRPRDIPPLT